MVNERERRVNGSLKYILKIRYLPISGSERERVNGRFTVQGGKKPNEIRW